MNSSRIKENALKYLGYTNQELSEDIIKMMDDCLEEIDQLSSFRVVDSKFSLSFDPLMIDDVHINIHYPDLIDLFKNCQEVIVIACTLGMSVDQRSHYYGHFNMTKMTIFDAVASSYLEEKCDEYENEKYQGKRTFRFCPGYGNVPIELNQELARVLDVYKRIGLTVQDSHILLPQKSMIGLIGLGDNRKQKSCLNCLHLQDCSFRKRGQTCYRKD